MLIALLLVCISIQAHAQPPTAAALMALTKTCNKVSTSDFAMDEGARFAVPVCGLNGAVFWRADMDIDCDGKPGPECNKNTDPWFQPMTSGVASNGEFLDAANLPFVVVPVNRRKFDYRKAGLSHGSAFVVIYRDKVAYGVFGDTNGESIIGEASYAMAKALGINPDPENGGIDGRVVTYIGFTGTAGIVRPVESHAEAVRKGSILAERLVANNTP